MALFREGYGRVDKEKENVLKQPALSAGLGHARGPAGTAGQHWNSRVC